MAYTETQSRSDNYISINRIKFIAVQLHHFITIGTSPQAQSDYESNFLETTII